MRTHGKSRTFFGIACLCVLGLAAFFGSGASPVGAAESFPGQGFLPDNRAWELVSPPQKLGSDVLHNTFRIRAAADGSAIAFPSFGGFAGAEAVPYATEYIAERTAAAGTNGWATHPITPPQQSLSFFGIILAAGEPLYQGDFSANLNEGVFKSWSPLTEAPNVNQVPGKLYLRTDLRSPGPGNYELLSDANEQVPTPFDFRAYFVGASKDFGHLLFETRRPLRANADGENVKLYESDGQSSVPRLIVAGQSCGFQSPSNPCSAAGRSVFSTHYARRTISSDGSRAEFTDPVNPNTGEAAATPGATSRLFQLDDNGTTTSADDALIELNASEATSPGFTQAATFQSASADGNRVFFISPEELVDGAPGGLYMWERKQSDEVQSLAVDASGGSFTLTAHAQPTIGRGNLTEGSNEVTGVNAGSFMVGQTVSGPGIPAGTTITEMRAGKVLILSQLPTETTPGARITADVEATTSPLPYDAGAAQVQTALEGLTSTATAPEEPRRLIGAGNVTVSGGPGSPGATTPYSISFTGALHGVDVSQLSADSSALTGGGASAGVTTTSPVHNLSLVAATSTDTTSVGAVDASEDGHRLYFITDSQLVSGAPPITNEGLYYWQDADGTPGGTLSFVGGIGGITAGDGGANTDIARWNTTPKVERLTPDGRTLIFEVSDGSALAPHYDQLSRCPESLLIEKGGNANNTGVGCSEIYVYRAEGSTPTEPNLVCASCNPSGAPATATAWMQGNNGSGPTATGTHLSHALSDDGRYVFFSTAERLVPEDVNGVEDAYVYDTETEEAHLLSSGEDGSPSYFVDASANGKDAFILTRQRLSKWDTDGNYDIYDARVGGGLPEPPPPPPSCQGDACQPTPPALNDPTPASSSFKGPGDPQALRKARHRHHRKNRHKSKRQKSKRTAKHNRRNAR